jgi:hypothetical protein
MLLIVDGIFAYVFLMRGSIEIPKGLKIIFSLMLRLEWEIRALTLRVKFLVRGVSLQWAIQILILVLVKCVMRLFENVKKCQAVILVNFIASIWGNILCIAYSIGVIFRVDRVLEEWWR